MDYEKILKDRRYVAFEFLILCIVIPGYIIYSKNAPFMFSFLYGGALYSFVILRFVYHDHLRQLWKSEAVTWENLKPVLSRFALASLGMTAFVFVHDLINNDPEFNKIFGLTDQDLMFRLVLEKPLIIPFILIAYPLISALPQEFIFCSFFFERYKPFFGTAAKMVWASAIIFAFAHVLYINPIAPTLSIIAGYIFASTYQKTQSLALVTIEHGLYGNYLFIIGLGWYFHGGYVAAQG